MSDVLSQMLTEPIAAREKRGYEMSTRMINRRSVLKSLLATGCASPLCAFGSSSSGIIISASSSGQYPTTHPIVTNNPFHPTYYFSQNESRFAAKDAGWTEIPPHRGLALIFTRKAVGQIVYSYLRIGTSLEFTATYPNGDQSNYYILQLVRRKTTYVDDLMRIGDIETKPSSSALFSAGEWAVDGYEDGTNPITFLRVSSSVQKAVDIPGIDNGYWEVPGQSRPYDMPGLSGDFTPVWIRVQHNLRTFVMPIQGGSDPASSNYIDTIIDLTIQPDSTAFGTAIIHSVSVTSRPISELGAPGSL